MSQERLWCVFCVCLCLTLTVLATSWIRLGNYSLVGYRKVLTPKINKNLNVLNESLTIFRNSRGMNFKNYKEFIIKPRIEQDITTEKSASLESLQIFLKQFRNNCNKSTLHGTNFSIPQDSYCPCVPDKLEGRFPGYHTIRELSSLLSELEESYQYTEGLWLPSSCTPRQVVALLVPYRDRGQHLRVFLNVLHRHLQKQLLGYKIILINQIKPKQFNRGILLNIGFLELMSRIRNISCIILHDVDLLPEDDYNFYTCDPEHPRHLSLFLDKYNYSNPYYGFGGASSMTPEHFKKINGFSTQYYGWGGEDDDLLRRILKAGLSIQRYPDFLTTYTSLMHVRDAGNEDNEDRMFLMDTAALRSHYGLNTTVYKIIDYQDTSLYTNISVTFPSKADTLDTYMLKPKPKPFVYHFDLYN